MTSQQQAKEKVEQGIATAAPVYTWHILPVWELGVPGQEPERNSGAALRKEHGLPICVDHVLTEGYKQDHTCLPTSPGALPP